MRDCKMKAIILAGGKAERMDGYPKPLTFVNGYTIIELEIEWLFKAGFSTNDILIACGNRSQIYDYARRFVPKNNIYFDGEKQLGDAGAIKKGMEIAGKNHSGALAWLAFVSLFSYGYWSLYALPILIGYIIFNYSLALCLANPDASRSCRFIAKLTVLFEDFIRFKIRKSMSN